MNRKELIIEQNISRQKIKSILKEIGGIDNFQNLSEDKKVIVSHAIIMELSYLQHNNLLNENIFKMLAGLNIGGAALQTIIEPYLNRVLRGLGLPDFLVFPIISTLTSNPSQLLKAFVDCKSLAKLLINVTVESYLMHIQKKKEWGGIASDFIRNAVLEAVKSSNLTDKLLNVLTTPICEMYNKIRKSSSSLLKGDLLAQP